MKQFILSSVIFLVFLFALTIAINFFLLFTGIYKQTVAGAEIYYSINKSKEKRKQKKIILGDSMGSQLFPNTINNSTFTSLACNQAIGMIGHYLLLNNALNAGNHFDTVFMVITPFSFQNNLNQIYTYHYFLKPFYNAEYSPLFTKTVNVQIQKIPYSNFCCYPYILTSNWAPDFASMDDITYTFLSPITIQYLDKIKELGFKYNFINYFANSDCSLQKVISGKNG